MGVAQKLIQIADFFGGYGLTQRTVYENSLLFFSASMVPQIGPRLSPMAKSLPIHRNTGGCGFFTICSSAITIPVGASLLNTLNEYSMAFSDSFFAGEVLPKRRNNIPCILLCVSTKGRKFASICVFFFMIAEFGLHSI